MIPLTIIKNEEVKHIYKEMFDNENNLKILSADYYNKLETKQLAIIGHEKAIYTFPTVELCGWLRHCFNIQNTIEIGAGNGALSKELNIKATDSMIQNNPEVKNYYAAFRQPTVSYGKNVEELEALDAIKKYEPENVIGCWITQKYDVSTDDGSIYGVDESKLIKKVKRYIMIGNEKVHGNKKIMKHKHKTYRYDWNISRSLYPENNIIYVWEN